MASELVARTAVMMAVLLVDMMAAKMVALMAAQ